MHLFFHPLNRPSWTDRLHPNLLLLSCQPSLFDPVSSSFHFPPRPPFAPLPLCLPFKPTRLDPCRTHDQLVPFHSRRVLRLCSTSALFHPLCRPVGVSVGRSRRVARIGPARWGCCEIIVPPSAREQPTPFGHPRAEGSSSKSQAAAIAAPRATKEEKPAYHSLFLFSFLFFSLSLLRSASEDTRFFRGDVVTCTSSLHELSTRPATLFE